MYDPLGSSSAAFGGIEDHDAPAWPTTPAHTWLTDPKFAHARLLHLRRRRRAQFLGYMGRTHKYMDNKEPGLVSPRETLGSNGATYEKPEPYLRVRINGLDRNRRDILVKLDAQVFILSPTSIFSSFSLQSARTFFFLFRLTYQFQRNDLS